MTGEKFGSTMAIEESKANDGDDKEEGACAHVHHNKNYLMKLLMHYADKCMKQEVHISSMKQRCLVLEGNSKGDEKNESQHLEKTE